jgi:protein TonB
MMRPPPPKAVVPPPEPPKPPPPPPKPVKALPPKPAAVAKPEPEKPAPEPPPQDTGSSLPSEVDGELYAGSGGLGTAPPAPPPPKPVVAPPPPPPPVIQAREGANYLKNPRPPYPSRALREGWEGTTLLRVQVSPLGKPGTIQIQTSSGRSVLDDAALEAEKLWSFTPATQGGKPIGGWVTVPIVFKLQ